MLFEANLNIGQVAFVFWTVIFWISVIWFPSLIFPFVYGRIGSWRFLHYSSMHTTSYMRVWRSANRAPSAAASHHQRETQCIWHIRVHLMCQRAPALHLISITFFPSPHLVPHLCSSGRRTFTDVFLILSQISSINPRASTSALEKIKMIHPS